MTKYAIKHDTLYGWEHWGYILYDDEVYEKQYFNTRAEAQAEIDDTIEDFNEQIRRGERGSLEGYHPEEFKIVEETPQ